MEEEGEAEMEMAQKKAEEKKESEALTEEEERVMKIARQIMKERKKMLEMLE